MESEQVTHVLHPMQLTTDGQLEGALVTAKLIGGRADVYPGVLALHVTVVDVVADVARLAVREVAALREGSKPQGPAQRCSAPAWPRRPWPTCVQGVPLGVAQD